MATVHVEGSFPNLPNVPSMPSMPSAAEPPVASPTSPTSVPSVPSVPSPATSAEPSRPLRHNPAFWVLFGGEAVSLIGHGTAAWALPFLALIRFQQPWILGLVTAVAYAPSLFVAMPAGVVADHHDRRVLMIACDAGRALLLGSLVVALVTDQLTLAQLLVVAFCEAALAEVVTVALSAALPEIVGRDTRTFGRATELIANLENLGQLLGPALGGLLAPVSWILPFGETALAFAASALSLSRVRRPFAAQRPPERAEPAERAGQLGVRQRWSRQRWSRELAEGIRWLWRQPTLRMVALLSGLANIVMVGLPALVTLYGYSQGFSAPQIGLVVTCCGLGALVGAVITAPVVSWWGFGPVYIVFSLLQAVLWPALLLAHTVVLVALVAAIAGAIDQIVSVAQRTYRSLLIPDALRARVQGTFRAAIYAGGVVGLLAQGAADQRYGIGAVVWAGTVLLALAGIWSLLVSSVRHAPPPDRPIPWMPAAWTKHYSTYGATRVFPPDVPSTSDLPNTPYTPSTPSTPSTSGTPWGMPGVVVFPAE